MITDDKIHEFKKIKKISLRRGLRINSLFSKNYKFQILSHFFKDETQVLKIKYKNSLKKINLKLIGKIQLKNILMAIIAAEKSNIDMNKILKVIPKLNQSRDGLKSWKN